MRSIAAFWSNSLRSAASSFASWSFVTPWTSPRRKLQYSPLDSECSTAKSQPGNSSCAVFASRKAIVCRYTRCPYESR